MNAKTAKLISEASKQSRVKRILTLINEEASFGETILILNKTLDDELIAELQNLGYEVKKSKRGCNLITIITW